MRPTRCPSCAKPLATEGLLGVVEPEWHDTPGGASTTCPWCLVLVYEPSADLTSGFGIFRASFKDMYVSRMPFVDAILEDNDSEARRQLETGRFFDCSCKECTRYRREREGNYA